MAMQVGQAEDDDLNSQINTTPLVDVDSAVEVVPGAGHFLHLERPDEVNERIAAFLSA